MGRARPERSPADLARAARAVGVRDGRLLEAIASVPRAAFVPPMAAEQAYADEPIPIPHGQVTTQPSLSAAMIDALGLTGAERVLEIGTGYGYQTALLARLATGVVSVEIWPDLAEAAERHLAAQGVRNVRVVAGDGSGGWEPGAPYDAVIVSAASPEVPAALIAQLRVGGLLVQPIGPGGDEQVTLFRQTARGLTRLRSVTAARFVPLRDRSAFPHRPD